MFKKAALLFFSCLNLASTANGTTSDFITYKWLTEKTLDTPSTDYIPHWRRLFNTMKVRGFLECGCGFSSGYFMDNADKVISIEYISPGYGDRHYQEYLNLFSDRSNWIPMTYNADLRSNSFNNACAYQCSMHKDYAFIDATYLKELYQHFKTQIKNAQQNGYDIDVAFVNPGVYVRGDMVKLLLALKIPIVVAHDTASDAGNEETENLYGWNKVVTPFNYVKIYIPFGQGTTFWISNQLPEIIASMQEYRDKIIQLQEMGFVVGYGDLTTLADEMP